ncbi:MAG: autotransporter-associated beta strand repeat-containing protein [Acidobacteriota bacterium]
MPRPPHSQSVTRRGAPRSSSAPITHHASPFTRIVDSWFRWPAIWSVIVLSIVGTAFFLSQAANATWSATPTTADWVPGGGDTNWSTGAGTFPGATAGLTNADTATFTGPSTQLNITVNSSSLNIKSITFSGSNEPAYTIGTVGGNPLLLTSGGSISIASNVTGANITNAVNSPLILEPPSTITAGSYSFSSASGTASHPLVIGDSVTPGTTSAGIALTLQGANTGANAISGTISNGSAGAGLALIKDGNGTWTLSGANTFSGGITIHAGTLKAGSNTALGSPTNNTVAFGSASTGELQLNGFNATVIGLNTNANVGSPIVENGAAGTATFTDNTNAADNFGGVLQNGTTGTLALTKGGGGNLILQF